MMLLRADMTKPSLLLSLGMCTFALFLVLASVVACSLGRNFTRVHEFDLGGGRKIRLLSSSDADDRGEVYYQLVTGNNVECEPSLVDSLNWDYSKDGFPLEARELKRWRIIWNERKNVVGIVANDWPYHIPIIWDFENRKSFPAARDFFVGFDGLERYYKYSDDLCDANRVLGHDVKARDFRVLRNAVVLRLHGKRVTNEIVRDIPSLKLLEELDLSFSSVSELSTVKPSMFPKLRRLDLTNTPITDQGLSDFSSEAIEVIGLSRTSVSEKSLKNMEKWRNLKRVSLYETRINREKLLEWKQKLTRVTLEY